jgi:hypothetical protein
MPSVQSQLVRKTQSPKTSLRRIHDASKRTKIVIAFYWVNLALLLNFLCKSVA